MDRSCPTSRVESLDSLRGMLAVCIMLYHYAGWSRPGIGAEHLLGRLSIYAVSTFYILSGLSLTIVYRNRFQAWGELRTYVMRRVFRIAPLLWLATTLQLLAVWNANRTGKTHVAISLGDVLLNYSLLFGFVKPEAYVATGAWSIGNELVFYSVFPTLIVLSRRSRVGFWLCVSAAVALFLRFTLGVLQPSQPLDSQWTTYINPANQLLYFVAGVVLGLSTNVVGRSRWSAWTLSGLCLLFGAYPASGDAVQLVTGTTRLVLSAVCVTAVGVVYRANPQPAGIVGAGLRFLGRISYSLYLLHPLVFHRATSLGRKLGLSASWSCWLVAVPTAVGCAWLAFRFLEQPLMRFARTQIPPPDDSPVGAAGSRALPCPLRASSS